MTFWNILQVILAQSQRTALAERETKESIVEFANETMKDIVTTKRNNIHIRMNAA